MPGFLKLIEQCKVEEVRRILTAARGSSLSAHVHCTDPSGLTPMHYAAASGSIEIIEMLHANGANLDVKGTRNQISPMHIAVAADLDFVVRRLISLGANKDIEDVAGITPLGYAFNMPPDKVPFKAIKELIIHGCVVIDYGKYTKALLAGVRNNELEAFKELEQYSEKANKPLLLPDIDFTPLKISSYVFHAVLGLATDVLEYVLDKEAKKRSNIAEKSKSLALVLAIPRPTPFHFIEDILPSVETLNLPTKLLATRGNNMYMSREALSEIISEADSALSLKFTGDKYYIESIRNGFVNLEYNERGEFVNKDEILADLRKTLGILVRHGFDINKEYNNITAIGKLIHYPKEVLEVFRENGAMFTLNDLHRAMLECDADKVKYIISTGVKLTGRSYTGKTTSQILDECENERMLNIRGELMTLVDKAEKEQKQERLKRLREAALSDIEEESTRDIEVELDSEQLVNEQGVYKKKLNLTSPRP